MSNQSQSPVEVVRNNTMKLKLPLWSRNLRDNLPDINNSSDISELDKITGTALCLAAGESLTLHLDEIREFKGTILSCERNLVPLLERGIIPDYVISIDGDSIMAEFIDHPLVDQHAGDMTAIFATTASPKTVQRWKGKKVFFTAWLDDVNDIKSVSVVFKELTNKSICHTGGHCGAALWFLSCYLNASTIILLGVDMAYPATIPDLSHTSIWSMINHLPREEILNFYRRETNPFGNEVITDYVWEGFKDTWLTWIQDAACITIQCSDYTILHESPIKTMLFKEYLQKNTNYKYKYG